jgi:hypothetical protein
MTVVKHKIVIVILPCFFCLSARLKVGQKVGPSSVIPIKSRVSVALQLSFGASSEFPKMARQVMMLIPGNLGFLLITQYF